MQRLLACNLHNLTVLVLESDPQQMLQAQLHNIALVRGYASGLQTRSIYCQNQMQVYTAVLCVSDRSG